MLLKKFVSIHSLHQCIKPRAWFFLLPSLLATNAGWSAEFTLGEFDGLFTSAISSGSSWRLEDPDLSLISPGNSGGEGTAATSGGDDGNSNFDKGEAFSSIIKGHSSLSLDNGRMGLFTRVRYWYDAQLSRENRSHGNAANLYLHDEPLDDSNFSSYARSSGIKWLDAYFHYSTELAEIPMNFRVGRQVLSWGESAFIQNGINIINPVDVSALRQPGSELKEALLPVGLIYSGLGLTEDLSVDLFYQYEWQSVEQEGCGTYFSTDDGVAKGCNLITLIETASDRSVVSETQTYSLNGLIVPIENAYLKRSSDLLPRDDGQWGVAAHYQAEQLMGAELGLYYIRYHSRTPILSGIKASQPFILAPLLGGQPGYALEYPENIELYAISFSTSVASWALSGELSHRPDLPLQINGVQIFQSLALGEVLAPWSDFNEPVAQAGAGDLVQGYDNHPFTQLQFNLVNVFDHVLGASELAVVGEWGINFIGDMNSSQKTRYGRSAIYGVGDFSLASGQTCKGSDGNTGSEFAANSNAGYCTEDGFITPYAWGYRLLFSLEYPDAAFGITLKPSLAWSHDVKGYSPPPNFNEGNQSLDLALNLDYLNQYAATLSYTQYSGGDYNVLRDRDFASISFSIKF